VNRDTNPDKAPNGQSGPATFDLSDQPALAEPARREKRTSSLEAVFSSGWCQWTTPDTPGGVLERTRRIGGIALDPCSNAASRVRALVEFWGAEEMHARWAREAEAERIEGEGARLSRARREDRLEAAGARAVELLRRARQELQGQRRIELVDGLAESWQGYVSLAYVNPPYGRVLPQWVKKCADEGAAGAEVVLLVPARTDTVWCHEQVFQRAQAACFWRGRLNFENPPPGSARPGGTFPPLVAYWGPRRDAFFAAFAGAGELSRLNDPDPGEEQEDGHAA
jgi:hypothetical protein